MSETSLIASNTKKPAELFKLSREQIIQSRPISFRVEIHLIILYFWFFALPLVFVGHIIGSVGNVMPYVKVKVTLNIQTPH